ncbi:hypothetical protein QZH41_012816 [Actinostola sp. cb2023]|nr:hypothetical protein QZH41_012816 [Actinostola sp. cb2023]
MAVDLTTAEVYEIASVIGQDIEEIINRYGHEAVLDLMPRIVQVLEELELLVCEREKEKLEIAELKMENERLYFEIKREACHRRQLDEELFHAKKNGELKSLKTTVVKLQEENKRLRLEFEMSANEKPDMTYVSAPGDAEVMQKMKETIDTQRDVIRSRNLEIENQKGDVDAMEEQVERLMNINESLRKNLATQQARMNSVAKEKAEYEAELKILKIDISDELDAERKRSDIGVCIEEEFAKMDAQFGQDIEEPGNEVQNGQEIVKRKEDGWDIIQVTGGEDNQGSQKTLERDPNRPRYTRAELQEILAERNKLKEECFSLREELSWYKPK